MNEPLVLNRGLESQFWTKIITKGPDSNAAIGWTNAGFLVLEP